MASKTLNKPKNSEPSMVGKFYLIAYNTIQTIGLIVKALLLQHPYFLKDISTLGSTAIHYLMCGNIFRWTYLLWQSLIYFLNRGTLGNYWQEVKWTVIIFQNAAILEVVHAIVKLVPSSPFVVLMQVYSRVFLVCGVLLTTDAAVVSPGLPICVFAWSITEIIRYAYYALNLINAVPQALLFLRYSTFLVLYPIGITGELLCMYHPLDEVAEKKLFTVSMPNTWNFIFNYQYFLMFYMFLYVPLFPVLFGHMLKQRNKMLGLEKKSH